MLFRFSFKKNVQDLKESFQSSNKFILCENQHCANCANVASAWDRQEACCLKAT